MSLPCLKLSKGLLLHLKTTPAPCSSLQYLTRYRPLTGSSGSSYCSTLFAALRPHWPLSLTWAPCICSLSAWHVLHASLRRAGSSHFKFQSQRSLTLCTKKSLSSSCHLKFYTVLIHRHFHSFAFCLCFPIRIQSFN